MITTWSDRLTVQSFTSHHYLQPNSHKFTRKRERGKKRNFVVFLGKMGGWGGGEGVVYITHAI